MCEKLFDGEPIPTSTFTKHWGIEGGTASARLNAAAHRGEIKSHCFGFWVPIDDDEVAPFAAKQLVDELFEGEPLTTRILAESWRIRMAAAYARLTNAMKRGEIQRVYRGHWAPLESVFSEPAFLSAKLLCDELFDGCPIPNSAFQEQWQVTQANASLRLCKAASWGEIKRHSFGLWLPIDKTAPLVETSQVCTQLFDGEPIPTSAFVEYWNLPYRTAAARLYSAAQRGEITRHSRGHWVPIVVCSVSSKRLDGKVDSRKRAAKN